MAKTRGPPFPNLRNYPCNLHPAGIAIWVIQKIQLVGKEGQEPTTVDTPIPRTSRTRRSSTASAAEEARLDSQRIRKAKQRAENWVKNKENDIVARARLDGKRLLNDDVTEAERQNWVEQRCTEDYDRLLDFNATHISPYVRDFDPFFTGYAEVWAEKYDGDLAEAMRLLVDVMPALTSSSPTLRSCNAAIALVKALKDNSPHHDTIVDAMRILCKDRVMSIAVDRVVGYLFSPRPSMPSMPRNPYANLAEDEQDTGLTEEYEAVTPTQSGLAWQTHTTPGSAGHTSRESRLKREYCYEDSKIDPVLLHKGAALEEIEDEGEYDDNEVNEGDFTEDYERSACPKSSASEAFGTNDCPYTKRGTWPNRKGQKSSNKPSKRVGLSMDSRKTRSSSRISSLRSRRAVNYVDTINLEDDDPSYALTLIRSSRRSHKPTENAQALFGTGRFSRELQEDASRLDSSLELDEEPLAFSMPQSVTQSALSDVNMNMNTRDNLQDTGSEITVVDHHDVGGPDEQTNHHFWADSADLSMPDASNTSLGRSFPKRSLTANAMEGTEGEEPARKRANSEFESEGEHARKQPRLAPAREPIQQSSAPATRSAPQQPLLQSIHSSPDPSQTSPPLKHLSSAAPDEATLSTLNRVRAPSRLRQPMSFADADTVSKSENFDEAGPRDLGTSSTRHSAAKDTTMDDDLEAPHAEDVEMSDAGIDEVQAAATLIGLTANEGVDEKDLEDKCDWCANRIQEKAYRVIQGVMEMPCPDTDQGDDYDYQAGQAEQKKKNCTCHLLASSNEANAKPRDEERSTETGDAAAAKIDESTSRTSALEELAALPVGIIRKGALQGLVERAQSESQESDGGDIVDRSDKAAKASKPSAPERARETRRPKRASSTVPAGTRGSLRATRAAQQQSQARSNAMDENLRNENEMLNETQRERLDSLRISATQRNIRFDARTTIRQLNEILSAHTQGFREAQMQFMQQQQQYVTPYMPNPQFAMQPQPLHGMAALNPMQQPVMGYAYPQPQMQQTPQQFYGRQTIDLTQSPSPGQGRTTTLFQTAPRSSSASRGGSLHTRRDVSSPAASISSPSFLRSTAAAYAGQTATSRGDALRAPSTSTSKGRKANSLGEVTNSVITNPRGGENEAGETSDTGDAVGK